MLFLATRHVASWLLDQGLKPSSLQWKHKVFIEFVTVLCFYFSSWFGFLVLRHVASWLPNQGPNSHLRTLESEVLATRPPGSSQFSYFLSLILLLHAFSDFTDRYYRVFHMLLVFRLQCSKLGIHFPLD